ncbi:MAG: diguanylate cyclase [Alphaproteobacteria bacterium]|nr:diguanylate cyclase [Alphaproteobacteria bacterium]
MEYPQNQKEAAKFAAGAVERMAELGITANPQNFTVWYAYLSGFDTSFGRHIDSMLAKKEPFDDTQCADLYAAVLRLSLGDKEGTREAAIDAVGGDLEKAIAATTEILKQTGSETERYGETLEGVDGALQSAGTAEQMQSVVANLVEQTRLMVEQNRNANESLQKSNNEIAELKIRMADIRSEALTDPLTGLANRRAFSEELADGMSAATEQKAPLCLLMLDIDHFKAFNDTYGHQLGDEVIRLVAGCMSAKTKDGDTAARYGGEEFSVILPEASLQDAEAVAEQIRVTVAGQKIVRKASRQTLGSVTLSIGVAQLRAEDSDEDLIARADAALYAAKHAGRNCVQSENDLAEDADARNVA